MITVRSEQMAAFAAPREAAFLARVRLFIQAKAPDLADRDGAGLDASIAAGLAAAGAQGCETEQELVLFVVLSLLHGQGFEAREPWAIAAIARHRAAGRRSGLAQGLMDASKRAHAVTA